FNELLLEISAEDTELYEGKLKDFTPFSARFIDSMDEEELTMTIRFPEHLGNEFQGLSTNFSFIFVAKGTLDTQYIASIDGAIGSGGTPMISGFLSSPTTILASIVVIGLCGINVWLIYQFYRKRK